MSEDQHIEYKESWRDEFLKTIAAFANTEGGDLFIGKDDKGKIVGVEDAKVLLETLPNKIVNRLGIYASICLLKIGKKNIIQISVDKYDTAIPFNGKFFIRSGSTTQELKDKELSRFLLKKNRLSWEGITEDRATLDEIKEETIEQFKKMARKRIPGIENEDTLSVLKKLHLIDIDGKLKRAAILLFGKDPLKYYHSAYFKVGKFLTDTDLVTDDVIEGNLFEQLTLIFDVLRIKYLRLLVKGYKNLERIEEYEYPEEAMREAVINALVHKDYTGSHTQMKIYPDKIILWNPGTLLEGISIEDLKTTHQSVLRNELICNVFYKANLIESWGRGTVKITENCLAAGLPAPDFHEAFGGFEVVFYQDKFTEKYLRELGLNERQIKAVLYVKEKGKITNSEYQALNDVSKPTATRDIQDLEERKMLINRGSKGSSSVYELNNTVGSVGS